MLLTCAGIQGADNSPCVLGLELLR